MHNWPRMVSDEDGEVVWLRHDLSHGERVEEAISWDLLDDGRYYLDPQATVLMVPGYGPSPSPWTGMSDAWPEWLQVADRADDHLDAVLYVQCDVALVEFQGA